MRSKHAITKFIKKHGKNKWLKLLNERLETLETGEGIEKFIIPTRLYVEEVLKQQEIMQIKINRLEEQVYEIKQIVERLEVKP